MDPSLERTLRGHKNYVTSLSFSPSMKQLASGSGDNFVMLWNFKPQLRAFRFIGHKGVVTDVKFSPEGDILASASKDTTVRLWVPNVKGESVTLKGHAGAVRSVSFSKDSGHLLTSSDDKTAKIWSLPSRKFVCTLSGHSNWVRSASFSPDASLVVSGGDDKLVKLWDVPTHQCLHSFFDHTDVVNSATFHPDGSCVASCSADRSIKMWDVRSHQLVQHYAAHGDSVTKISIDQSGCYLVSSSKDSTLKIWDLREGRLLYTLQGHTGPAHTTEFSPDSQFFASGGADQLVMVWKANLFAAAADGAEVLGSFGAPDWTAPLMEAAQKRPASHQQTARMHLLTSPEKTAATRASLYMTGAASPSPSLRTLLAAAPRSKSSQVHLPGLAGDLPPKVSATGLPPKSAPSVGTVTAAAAGSIPRKARVGVNARSSTNKKNNSLCAGQDAGQRQSSTMPPAMQDTLDHIVGQLDLITKTMTMLEHRLRTTEDKLAGLLVQEVAGQYGLEGDTNENGEEEEGYEGNSSPVHARPFPFPGSPGSTFITTSDRYEEEAQGDDIEDVYGDERGEAQEAWKCVESS